MQTFNAFRIHKINEEIQTKFEQISLNDLNHGEVVIKVIWSGINYKDALAATGKGKILRKFPLVGGVDLSGFITQSVDPRYKEGDKVLVCGCGLSEIRDGGYAEYARVDADHIVPLPDGLSLKDAMIIGTAGFTAAMAMVRMEDNRQTVDHGSIVVTGATGGVGCFAVDIFSLKGFDVVAFTGKKDQYDFLSSLGATDFIDRHSIEMGSKPLEKSTWGGAVDNVGGETLGWLTRTVKPWGNIASIGLVSDYKLNTTVMPFILRGVSLLGINSIEMPSEFRKEIWSRLGADLRPQHLDKILQREVAFADLANSFGNYISGESLGKTIVKIQSE